MPKRDHILGVGPLWGLTWLPPAGAVVWADRAYAPFFSMNFLPVAARIGCGVVLALTGITLVVWSVRTLRRHRERGQLCTAGPYARARHPLYAAWVWFLVPSIAFFANCWLALALPPLAALTLQWVVGREEAKLEALYGEAYRAYRQRVGGILPRRHIH